MFLADIRYKARYWMPDKNISQKDRLSMKSLPNAGISKKCPARRLFFFLSRPKIENNFADAT